MKNVIFAVGGLCAAALGWLVWGRRLRLLNGPARAHALPQESEAGWADRSRAA
jgi:hypothetical protein